jgi:hypothetical protein
MSFSTTHFKYYDFSRHWSKLLLPVIESPQAQCILKEDFRMYLAIKRENFVEQARRNQIAITGHEWRYDPEKMPVDYDSCAWRFGRRLPAWHTYVCHGACHFIVNTLLYVASTAMPTRAWRIVTSDAHSTLWDGQYTLFDLNFVTIKVPVETCIKVTFEHPSCQILQVGQYLTHR